MLSPILQGTVLHNRYRLLGLFTQNQWGRTYLAQDQKRGDELCLLQELVPILTPETSLEQLKERFQTEAAAIYELQHPQICRYRVMLIHEQRLLLVRQYVEGKTYRMLLEERKLLGFGFSEMEVGQLMMQLLPVLTYLHSRGLIHREITPDTIVLREQDQLPVLIDLAVVKQLIIHLKLHPLDQLTIGVGVPGYAPSEQILIDKAYPNSDLHALAVTALVLMTGREPRELYNSKTQTWIWPDWGLVSPSFARILKRMLSKKPGSRYPSAGRLARDLQPLLGPPEVFQAEPDEAEIPENLQVSPVLPEPTLPLPNEFDQSRSPVLPPDPADHPHQIEQPEATELPPTTAIASPEKVNRWNPDIIAAMLISLLLVSGTLVWTLLPWLRQGRVAKPSPSPPVASSRPSAALPRTAPVKASPTNKPLLSSSLPQDEAAAQIVLRNRRRSLGISYQFFADLVDEAFYTRHPELQGQRLSKEPAQLPLRRKWNEIAAVMLSQLALLSGTARHSLGSFSRTDFANWTTEIGRYHLSSRSLTTLTDARFHRLFPEQRDQQLSGRKFGQVWYAIAYDQMTAIRNGSSVETINPRNRNSFQETLQPGQGRVYLVYLGKGSRLTLAIEAPAQTTRLFIYAPPANATSQALLQGTSETRWSGSLAHTGYYEVLITSTASTPISYQLNLSADSSTTRNE